MSKYFKYKFKIYYEDTDSGGIVYYANYLKFIERARTDAIASVNFTNSYLKENYGIYIIVKSCNLNFIKPSRLEDKLNIFSSSNFKDFKKTKISQTDKDALQVMELNDDAKWEKIHTKFKELVKKYHPDKNQGSKKFEDKLKKITLAYSQLKKTLGKK